MADFFNKVIAGINSGVNTVSENSKLFVEKTKLSAAIKDRNDKKIKIAQQIGLALYQMHKNGELTCEQFNDMYAEIDNYNNEIEELNVQLLNLQNTVDAQVQENSGIQCQCGHYNKKGAAFCAGCGAKLNKEGA